MNFNGIAGVYYREMQVLRTRFGRSIIASMVSPALFLVAFGYGIGRGQTAGGMAYLPFLFAGLLAMSTLNSTYGINTEINLARFHLKTFDEYLTAPVPRWQIVFGEMLFGMTKGAIPLCIFIFYALIAGIELHPRLAFIPVVLLHMAAFSLLGFIVAVSVRNHGDQFLINTFLITPMTFLSGVFFPIDRGPHVFQLIVQIFPLTHSVSLIRATLTGSPLNLFNLAVFCGFLVLFYLLALYFAKRTEG